MSPRARNITVKTLILLASACLVLALVAGYVRRVAVNSDQFANRATAALRDDSVRSLVAEKVTDDVVIKQQSDLLAARPLIESVSSAVIGSRAFTSLFRSAVRDVHRSFFDQNSDTVTLRVADVGTVIAAALDKLRPDLAKQVQSSGDAEIVRADVGSVGGKATRITDDIHVLAILLFVVAIVATAGAIWLSADRRSTISQLGIGVAAAGVLLVVAYGVARSIAIDHVHGPDNRAAAGAVWDAFLGDLRTAAWILAGSGAVVAAAAASLIKPLDVREPLRRAAAWVTTEPRTPALKVLRGVGLVAAGVIVLVRRDAVIRLLFALAGVYLIYEGVSVILRLIYRPAPAAPSTEPRRVTGAVRRHWRRVAVPAIAIGLIAAVIAIDLGSGGVTTAAPVSGTCEGKVALCDRPLNEVALPATHNAMSVPLPGWYSAEQERPIKDQLADGIRGLLIDTHYGDLLPNGKVRTYFGSPEELHRRAQQDGVSPDAVDAALRIRSRVGFSGTGKRGMYLCHTFCELGATPLASVLNDINDFLVNNPGAVLVIINQDYVTPADFVAALNKAGLGDLAYSGSTADWPTLEQMIDDNQRVVFLAENHAGAAPWYRPAYKQILQETPFHFTKVAQLTKPAELPASCEPNRGPKNAPLFLINHWISTDPVPLPSNGAKVNAYGPLLRRARECQRLRKSFPNLLAVNFYKEGDLFRVVDTLNGFH